MPLNLIINYQSMTMHLCMLDRQGCTTVRDRQVHRRIDKDVLCCTAEDALREQITTCYKVQNALEDRPDVQAKAMLLQSFATWHAKR